MIGEFRSPAQVRAACGDDDLLVWAAGELRGGRRAWWLGDAVVVAAPGLSRHDRLAVWGGTACAASLVEHALAEVGVGYRPFGDSALVAGVASRVDGLRVAGSFSWMGADRLSGEFGPSGEVRWLSRGEESQVGALLAVEAPYSYAVPGMAGVSRWAGVCAGGGLASVAAEAWSAPTVGFLAGVATAAAHRGRGLAGRVCRWVSAELLAAHGRVALMVDDTNAAALAVYERLGFTRRRVSAAGLQTV